MAHPAPTPPSLTHAFGQYFCTGREKSDSDVVMVSNPFAQLSGMEHHSRADASTRPPASDALSPRHAYSPRTRRVSSQFGPRGSRHSLSRVSHRSSMYGRRDQTSRQGSTWEYLKRRGIWASYPPKVARQLTAAQQRGAGTVAIRLRGVDLTIDLKNMKQRNAKDGTVRSVRCSASPSRQEQNKCYKFKISALDLLNHEDLRIPNPYLVVKQGTRVLHISEVLPNSSMPSWEVFTVPYASIDPNDPIEFSVLDYQPRRRVGTGKGGQSSDDDEDGQVQSSQSGNGVLLGRIHKHANQLTLLTQNSVETLGDTHGDHRGEMGRIKFNWIEVSRALGIATLQGRAESSFPVFLSILDRIQTGKKVEYCLQITPGPTFWHSMTGERSRDANDVARSWTIRRKFGLFATFYESVKNLLTDYLPVMEPFPPRPRSLFGHSQRFLDTRQLMLRQFCHALSRIITGAFPKESKESKSLRSLTSKFICVEPQVCEVRRQLELLRNAAIAQTAERKIREIKRDKKDLEERLRRAQSARKRIGLRDDWKLRRITPKVERKYKSQSKPVAPELVFYYSSAPGSTAIRKRTMRFLAMLDAFEIVYEPVDVSLDRKRRDQVFTNSKAAYSRTLPQLFRGKAYLAVWADVRRATQEGALAELLRQ